MNSIQLRIVNTSAIASSLALGLAAPSVAATSVNGGFESPVLAPGGRTDYSYSLDSVGKFTFCTNLK